MKKHIIKIAFIIVIFFSNLIAQNQLKLSPSVGIFIYNSENPLKITDDGNFLLNYGIEVSYLNQNLFNHNIQLDYSFIYAANNGALEFVRTSGFDIGTSYVDASLSFHIIDILLKNELSEILFYGIGPSFSIVNRNIFYDKENFEDRLASFNIGLSATIDMITPLSENSTDWNFYGGIKLRYLYGLIYDEKGRDLSNYNQHFLTLNLIIGLSYSL
ncbi:MAG TPA: hypothetical protein VLH59_04500 [Ignavibacteriaceae bacterium]|nr:hypothetical protein [Ignavibacteriaceae bacterium]